MESSETLLKKALQLKPQDRFLLVDGLIRSLDEPDGEIDEIWTEEAEKRLIAHREGKTQGVPFKSVFGEEL
jgi:putative addiction module component (TIGR02574 family)